MREELVIERRSIQTNPANATDPAVGPSNNPDLTDYQDQPIGKLIKIGEGEVIRIPIRTEQILIEKRPAVTEELIVGKRHIQETRRFTGTVQREEAHVEREGNVTIHGQGN